MKLALELIQSVITKQAVIRLKFLHSRPRPETRATLLVILLICFFARFHLRPELKLNTVWASIIR